MAEKEFTATEVMALQERLEKGITVIAEQYSGIKQELKTINGRLENLEEKVDIAVATLSHKASKTQVDELEKRVEVLEANPA